MGTPITFERLHNVRDLGGMTTSDGQAVRVGRLLRGDQLAYASEHDLERLRGLGVRKVVDLRSVDEHEEKPDPAIPDAENVFLPIFKDVRTGITRGTEGNARIMELFMKGEAVPPSFIDERMCSMYRSFVEDPFANSQYAQFIDEVIATAEEGGATYWHCTAGKDRAGFAAAMLLAALGVERDGIAADYLQTNACVDGVVGQLMSQFGQMLPNDDTRAALMRFFVADEIFLNAAFDAIDERHGSVDAFLADRLDLDDGKRQKLRDLLLEG